MTPPAPPPPAATYPSCPPLLLLPRAGLRADYVVLSHSPLELWGSSKWAGEEEGRGRVTIMPEVLATFVDGVCVHGGAWAQQATAQVE